VANKKSPAAIAGYVLVFVGLGVALYLRQDMIKEFIGIKPDVSEALKERDLILEEARKRKEEGEKTTVEVDPELVEKAQQLGIPGVRVDPVEKAVGPMDIPMPGQTVPAGALSQPGQTEMERLVRPAPGATQKASGQTLDPGVPGLKGAYVEVIRPTELYQGRRVLSRAPQGARFRVLDERLDEQGNRWLMVPFKRRSEEAPISGWIRWDDVTLASAPVQVQEADGVAKEEGGEGP